MRARDIVGKTVARVEQVPMTASWGGRVYSVERIHFTDGSFVALMTVETEEGLNYAQDVIFVPARKARK